jgi:hypothetical protein
MAGSIASQHAFDCRPIIAGMLITLPSYLTIDGREYPFILIKNQRNH